MAAMDLPFEMEIDRYETTGYGVSGKEAVVFVNYRSETAGKTLIGEMNYDKELMPADSDDMITCEARLTFTDSPRNISRTITETESTVELRADYIGVRPGEHPSVMLVYREPDADTDDDWRGWSEIYIDDSWDGEFDFVDKSNEVPGTGLLHEPYDSYYVTVEVAVESEELDS